MFYRDEPPTKKEPVGRPQDEDQTVAFLKVAQFLQENDDEQITVNDLIEIMNEFLEESQSIAYGHTHMKARLKENFGDQLIITEINEKSNVVTLRGFFRGNHHGKGCGRKRVSIGQAIMQAARPRVLLAPLQIGLGVQLHHHFVSRFRIDSLHRLGSGCSYQEVQRFRKNAAVTHGTGIPTHTSEFVQYVADNVDHNLRTLDGNDTFHGMGLIATVTPGTNQTQVIFRRKVNPTEISASGQVQIQYQRLEGNGEVKIRYRNVCIRKSTDTTTKLVVLWKTSLLFGV